MKNKRRKKNWDDDLPDTSKWLPKKDSQGTLTEAFFKRCQHVEQQIILRAKLEKTMNINNFDSGLGIEDIIREELGKLCPRRYSTRVGVIDDRHGNTAGECDIVIVNDIWFPAIKSGATETSRRFHFPIESAYAILEVKQSLNYESLDKAMEKLVICHRLYRPPTEKDRIVENRTFSDCNHATTNPLYSAIIATNLGPDVDMDGIVSRFVEICKTLKRKEIVRCLCVLGHGTIIWGADYDNGESKPALFMHDLYQSIFPVFCAREGNDSAFYYLVFNLLTHLYHSVLGAEDISIAYGIQEQNVAVPKDPNLRLLPDELPIHFWNPFEEGPLGDTEK